MDQAEDLAASDQPESAILQAEMSGCILGLVARLPEQQQEAILLRHFSGLSHREMADALGVSEGNARVILHRGLVTLRTNLGAKCQLDFTNEIPCERRVLPK